MSIAVDALDDAMVLHRPQFISLARFRRRHLANLPLLIEIPYRMHFTHTDIQVGPSISTNVFRCAGVVVIEDRASRIGLWKADGSWEVSLEISGPSCIANRDIHDSVLPGPGSIPSALRRIFILNSI